MKGDFDMTAMVFLFLSIYIAELIMGCVILYFISHAIRQVKWSIFHRRYLFMAIGVIIFSPVLAPAGTLAVMPVPFGVLMAFIRSSADFSYLLHTSWFIVLSMFVTALLCRHMARRIFPG
ncbi:hypothetical protein [Xanthomonas albilineans]|uniref:hypothetical protein n=1 Tax=Xanthomonas albilineans TaxID=29447 RepID=UPI0012D3C2FD|nr:hypothetical protein [Xanthomonas albilineans]